MVRKVRYKAMISLREVEELIACLEVTARVTARMPRLYMLSRYLTCDAEMHEYLALQSFIKQKGSNKSWAWVIPNTL